MKPVRNHLKLLAAAACFLLATATGFSGEEKTAAFPFYKDIILPEHPNDISVFTIDADIWRELRLDTVIQAGIRIVGPDGEFRPFDIWPEDGYELVYVARDYSDATITGFETLPDGSVRISASLTTQRFSDLDDAQVVGLRIKTRAKDFDKKVKVFDGSGNNLIAEGAFLDYSSRVNLRNDTITFPAPVPVKESSFVIVMDNYTEIKDSPRFRVVEGDSSIVEQEKYRESPKIDGIELQVAGKNPTRVKRPVSSPVTILSREKKGNTTVVKFSNGSAWLDSITVDSSDVFFSRPYRLYDDSGNSVSTGTVCKLDTAAFHTSPFDRVIPVLNSFSKDRANMNRSKFWTLELDNGEYNELKDLEIIANESVFQVRFLSVEPPASGETDASWSGYRVYYGGKAPYVAPPPEFREAAASLDKLKYPVRADSTLSEQKVNPQWDPSAASDYNTRDWGLVYKIIMAAAALAVFVILLFSVKKIDKVEG